MALNLDTSLKLGLILYLPEQPYSIPQLRDLLTNLVPQATDESTRSTLIKLLQTDDAHLRIRTERIFRESSFTPRPHHQAA